MIGLRTGTSRTEIPQLAERAARQRESDADEARWEAQLRAMAKRRSGEVERIVRPAQLRTALAVVGGRARHDSLLLPRTLPIATGGDPEDLVCGGCGAAITAGLNRGSARRRHPEGDRLLVRCPCRTVNLLSGKAGPRSPRVAKRGPPAPRRAAA